jgi:polyisoprenyl-phosphate glycosyltransferase
VIPCFDEEPVLPALRDRLSALELFKSNQLELVLVDDGSSDGTWRLLSDWARESKSVRAVKLGARRGVQTAMLTGLSLARGRCVGVMDADLQDPPELLAALLAPVEAGKAAAAIGLKAKRVDDARGLSFIKRAALSFLPFKDGEGEFCVMDRRAAEALLEVGGQDAPFRARRRVVLRGRPVEWVPYDREPRAEGRSKFTLPMLARFWWKIFAACYLGRSGGSFTPPGHSLAP